MRKMNKKNLSQMSTKELRIEAVAVLNEGIASDDNLSYALEVLYNLNNNLDNLSAIQKGGKTDAENLAQLCGEYVTINKDRLENQICKDGIIRRGDYPLNDRLVAVYSWITDGFKRISGELKDKKFLEALPKAWTKREAKLSTSNIEKSIKSGKFTDDDLKKHDLKRNWKHSWSWKIEVKAKNENDEE